MLQQNARSNMHHVAAQKLILTCLVVRWALLPLDTTKKLTTVGELPCWFPMASDFDL